MKAVVYFFSLWLLLLAGLPCPDATCQQHEQVATNAPASHPDDDHDHKAPCSPFCHCATCAGFFLPRLLSYTQPIKLPTGFSNPQFFSYQSPSQADVIQSVWQPPQL